MKRLAKLLGTVALAAVLAATMAQSVNAAGVFGFPSGSANGQTGNETIPMDTNLGQGINPATQVMTTQQLNLLGYVFVGINALSQAYVQSWSISNGIGTLLISAPTATIIQSFGISLPTTPVDGQTFYVSSNMSILTMQFSAVTGQSVNRAPTAMWVSTVSPYGYKFLYRSADTTWYRLQ